MQTPYPLSWPQGRPRARFRSDAKFNTGGKSLSITAATSRLQDELDRVGAREVMLSSNCERRLDGGLRSDSPGDPGVALYFKIKGRDTVMACDKWNRVADNIAAIAKHIEALRGQERWGVGSIEQAFMGFQALPAPEQWFEILGVSEHANLTQIEAVYRQKIADAHPDRQGGSDAKAARLNWARDEGRKARQA